MDSTSDELDNAMAEAIADWIEWIYPGFFLPEDDRTAKSSADAKPPRPVASAAGAFAAPGPERSVATRAITTAALSV